MKPRILLIAALLLPLGGCIATPRIELAQHIGFDAPMPNQTPLSYNDLLCCYDCSA